MTKFFVLFLFATLLSSCVVIHSGNVSSGPLLNVKDQYVDIVVGEAKSVFIIGLGNLEQDHLVLDAKKDLFSKLHLRKNEYYSNFTTDISKKYIFGPFIQIIKATVSADILKSNDSSSVPVGMDYLKKINLGVKPLYKPKTSNLPLDRNRFNANQLANGDTVYYSSDAINYHLYLVNQIDKESVVLKATGPDYQNILVPLLKNSFYFKNAESGGFKNGMEVVIEVPDDFYSHPVKKKFTVLGFCNDFVLLISDNAYFVRQISSLK